MGREIKFRAWSKRLKIMLTNDLMLEAGRQLTIFAKRMRPNMPDMQNAKGGLLLTTDDEDLVFMQYTGLHDRNGREIYEGDIVKGKRFVQHSKDHVRHIGEVAYASPAFRVNGVGQYKGIIHEELHSAYEIIGNIYENPNLIKD